MIYFLQEAQVEGHFAVGTELHRQSLEIAARYPAPWWGGMWVWIFLMEIYRGSGVISHV